jgi:glutamine synthetase
MADNAILYKFIAKSVGMKRGIMPSFMAKPHEKVNPFSITNAFDELTK